MSAYSDAILATPGLRAYWICGEANGSTLADSSGVMGDLAIDGAASLGQPALLPGDNNTSVQFDGSTRALIFTHNSSMDFTTSMSIVAWIKPTILKTHHVVCLWDAYGIVVRGSYVGWGLSGMGEINSTSNSIVANNTYMIAGTYNGTAQTLYINGVQVATAARSNQSIQQNGFSLEVGSAIGVERWVGNMGHVAMFSTGLSQAAIQNLFVLGAQTQSEAAGLSAQAYPFSRQIIAANPTRQKLTIWNDSDTTVYLCLGGSAAVGSGPRLNGNGDRWTTTSYTGAVSAIHGGYLGGKNLTISEE